MSWQKLFVVVGVILLVIIVWLGRYKIVSASNCVYRLDCWTGGIVRIYGGETEVVSICKTKRDEVAPAVAENEVAPTVIEESPVQ
ncbi:MAG: hypothetical protein AABX51_06055 [Nanoarchaeota archaeon]